MTKVAGPPGTPRRPRHSKRKARATFALIVGTIPQLPAPDELLWELRLAARLADVFSEDVVISGRKKNSSAPKRWTLASKPLRVLVKDALDGEDDALIELVRRDKSYAHTDLARAKVWLWHWQRWWGQEGMSTERALRQQVEASNKLNRFGEALASAGGRKRRWNAPRMRALYARVEAMVTKAFAAWRAAPTMSRIELDVANRISELAWHELTRGKRGRRSDAIWIEMAVQASGSAKLAPMMRKLHEADAKAVRARSENKSL